MAKIHCDTCQIFLFEIPNGTMIRKGTKHFCATHGISQTLFMQQIKNANNKEGSLFDQIFGKSSFKW